MAQPTNPRGVLRPIAHRSDTRLAGRSVRRVPSILVADGVASQSEVSLQSASQSGCFTRKLVSPSAISASQRRFWPRSSLIHSQQKAALAVSSALPCGPRVRATRSVTERTPGCSMPRIRFAPASHRRRAQVSKRIARFLKNTRTLDPGCFACPSHQLK